jgi:hypothetical protein
MPAVNAHAATKAKQTLPAEYTGEAPQILKIHHAGRKQACPEISGRGKTSDQVFETIHASRGSRMLGERSANSFGPPLAKATVSEASDAAGG